MKAYHIKNKAIISSSCRMKQRCIAAMAAVFLLMSPTAFAHKLNMFAYVEGDEIFAEGYFTDGKKAKNSTITVFDAADIDEDQHHILICDRNGRFKNFLKQWLAISEPKIL